MHINSLLFVLFILTSPAIGATEVCQQFAQDSSIQNKIMLQKDASSFSFLGEQKKTIRYDDGAIIQIKQNTKETARNTKKGGYEVLTVVVSAFALIVALITLYFSRKTFKSQKITQQNTTPIFTKDKQFEVLSSIAKSLLDNLFEAGATKLKIQNSTNNSIPSELLYLNKHIDSSELHLELFYDNKEEFDINPESNVHITQLLVPSSYTRMSNLKNSIDSYNNRCSNFSKQIQEKSIDIEDIKKEYDYYILRNIIELLALTAEVAKHIYPDKKNDIKTQIIQYVYVRMVWYIEDVTGHQVGGKTKFDKEKKEMTKDINGINMIFNGLENMWTRLFGNYRFVYALPMFEDLKIEDFIDFVKIDIAGEYRNSNTPSLKYRTDKGPKERNTLHSTKRKTTL